MGEDGLFPLPSGALRLRWAVGSLGVHGGTSSQVCVTAVPLPSQAGIHVHHAGLVTAVQGVTRERARPEH